MWSINNLKLLDLFLTVVIIELKEFNAMIDKSKFLFWARTRLGDHVEAGPEIKFNSLWREDKGHHLSCNIEGGKKKLKYGVFQCWKSNKKGTIVKLVMDVDKCNFIEALYKLGINEGPRPVEFFEEEIVEPEKELGENLFTFLDMPEGVVHYSKCNTFWKNVAKQYILERCISPDFFYVGIDGRYKGRLVIPYYDKNKNIIYFNGRTVFNSKLRYLGPPKECGVGKSDVIFMYEWFNSNDKIYLCEGEFDAISLNKSNLKGCAVGGKFVSIKQASVLANKRICLAFDNDDAGQSSIETSKKMLEKFGCQVTKVCPPDSIKDWNEFLVKHGPDMVQAYIERAEE
jgi:hypothetical protein